MKKFLLVCLVLSVSILGFSQSTTAITITNQYPDYPATPGDIYEITFQTSGSTNTTGLTGFVDGEYNIDLSFIGKVNVKGLIYTEVQRLLKNKITSAYPGSIVNISIKIPGKFKVTLLGEVNNSEIIEATSLTTLAQVISGKTTAYASFRDIEIRSEDGTIKYYDLFKFNRFADLKNNPFLKTNDVITIRPYSRVVTISGQIKRPGSYQLVEGDNLDTLINLYADGFTKLAQKSSIVISRALKENGEFADSTQYIDANNQDLTTVKLFDYDSITIENMVKYNPAVIIQGAISTDSTTVGSTVSNKLAVPITTDSRISTVINQMKGSFNLTSDLKNAFILRANDKIDINLEDIISTVNSVSDIVVLDGDMIVIPFRQLQVYVAGSVNKSGAVPFIENRTAEYYIGISGGFKQDESMFHTYSVRDMYGNKLKKDVIISPEDVIWVNKDHPMAYINEYGGWVISIAAIITAVSEIDTIIEALNN